MKTPTYLFICLLLLIVGSLQANGQEIPTESEVLFSIQAGDVEKLEEIVQSGGNLHELEINGKPIIFEAAVSPSAGIIRFLARENVSLNVVDDQGYSPVMAALRIGLIENAVLLSKLGASLDGIAKDGMTVRVLAEQSGLNNFGPIYDAKLPPIMTKQEANNLLLLAAEAGDWKAAKFALKNEANVFAKASNGWTPLMLAALGGHQDIFKQLLNAMGTFSDTAIAPNIEGISLIQAILIGKGREKRSAASMLSYLKRKRPNFFQDSGSEFRDLAKREKHSSEVIALFPQPPLPNLPYKLPFGMSATTEGWKQVQEILAAEGLYDGVIDGKPGKKTYRGLYAYVTPLVDVLYSNALEAAMRAEKPNRPQEFSGKVAYQFSLFKLEDGQYFYAGEKRLKGEKWKDGYYVQGKRGADKKRSYLSYSDKRFEYEAELNISFLDSSNLRKVSAASFGINLFDERILINVRRDKGSFAFDDTSLSSLPFQLDISGYDKSRELFGRLEKLNVIEKKSKTRTSLEKTKAAMHVGDKIVSRGQFFQSFTASTLKVKSGMQIKYEKDGKFRIHRKASQDTEGTYEVDDDGTLCWRNKAASVGGCYIWVVNDGRVFLLFHKNRYELLNAAALKNLN